MADHDGRAGPLGPFLDLRSSLIGGRVGDGGLDACHLLADELDRALIGLAARAESSPLSVVAVGGYGRRELSLYSDVDLMLLHDGRLGAEAVRGLLYPLWDAGLRVGHSTRTVREAAAAAKENIETFTALLAARLVTGNVKLVDDLNAELARLFRGERGRLEGVIAAEERHRRNREPYPLLEANLKNGRGGLRVFHAVDWMRRSAELVGGHVEPPDKSAVEARGRLLAFRNALHAVAGKQSDTYASRLRSKTAHWLGMSPSDVGHELYGALRTGDLLSRAWFPHRGLERVDPVAASGRWLIRAVRARSERPIHTLDKADFPLVRAAAVAQAGDLGVLTKIDEERIAKAPPPAWTEQDRLALVRLIGSGRNGREVFDRLVELGWVSRALPEWVHVVAAPQDSPIHLHTVDGHLWRTVDELLEVAGPESQEGWCRDFADELGNLDELLLAAFFHDIGKGLGGDHSEVGAELVGTIGLRIGLSPATGGLLQRLVRHHLLLPRVATRRDLDDSSVIRKVADLLGDEHAVRSLALLSVADSRATGPAVWNEWKSSLVRRLTFRVLDELQRRQPGSPEPSEPYTLQRVLELVGDEVSDAAVRDHVGGMPSGYLFRFNPEEIVRHLAVATPPPEPGKVRFDVDHRFPVSSLVLATQDRPGLLVAVAGVLALHSVSVLDARLSTRDDGVAIDTFHVADALGTGGVGKARWPDIRRDLRAVLVEEMALEELLAYKAGQYPSPSSLGVSVLVREIRGATIVEVRCVDRIGLLHDLAAAIAGSGFDVTLAKVDTRADRVVDVFYVRATDGAPISKEAAERLRSALEETVVATG